MEEEKIKQEVLEFEERALTEAEKPGADLILGAFGAKI